MKLWLSDVFKIACGVFLGGGLLLLTLVLTAVVGQSIFGID